MVEQGSGEKHLNDETHARLVSELRQIDDELERRGLPVDRRLVDAFEKRRLLPKEDMDRLSMQFYGEVREFKGITNQ